ncbi:carbohydrate kinase family protein [Sodalis sp. RH21]|uniref:carbohydrate kinase family protein n=1 Tax=unclassified Sodalis (in: enterobacteria) TaxID=2636512 RepID=UPI0039B4A5E2
MAAGKGLFVGDISLDTTLSMAHIPQPDEKVMVHINSESAGGVISNAALACRLAGADVALAIETGDDLFADSLLRGLQRTGLRIISRKVPGRTCRAIILLEPHGEKRLLLEPGVTLYPSLEWVRTLDLQDIEWVHTAAYGDSAWHLIERCRLAGCKWSLDLEPATFANGLEPLFPLLDGAEAVFCNQRALRQLGDDPVARLLGLGAKAVICTLGPQGARYVGADADLHARYPADAVIVDTTGAGDCLAGWFIAGRLARKSLQQSLTQAVFAATYSCGQMGAQPSYPSIAQLQQYQCAGTPDGDA